jgi:hypothetical protein
LLATALPAFCPAVSGLARSSVRASEHLKFVTLFSTVAHDELPQFQPAEICIDEFRARAYCL